jgi:peptidyl-prolyl cis-trans isomerase C
MKKILKDPLVYFFILGLVVFSLHSFLDRTDKVEEDPHTVDVTSADIEWLRSSYEARMNRKPTQQELEVLIDNYIREEILYREALAMGLDEGDTTIKRRLVMKMTFIFEDLAETKEPTDEELKEYMKENQEKYLIPEMISYTQVYFNPEKRENIVEEAETVLARLKSENITLEEAVLLGDPLMIDSSFRKKSPEEVSTTFGFGFTNQLFQLNGTGWQEPIESTYGLHLVYISDHTPSKIPEFENIREDVQSDFMYDHKKNVIDSAYNALKSRYTILVEGLPIE